MKEINLFDNSNGKRNDVLPDATTYAPRDGCRFGSSSDYLFEFWLTHNMIVNRHIYSSLLQCDSTHWNIRGQQIYLLVHNSGDLHHPITLEKVTPDSIRVTSRMKIGSGIKKIRGQFFDKYRLRASLYKYFFVTGNEQGAIGISDESPNDSSTNLKINNKTIYPSEKPVSEALERLKAAIGISDEPPNDSSAKLKINNKTIYPSEEPVSEALGRLNATLRWPLVAGIDPVIGDWEQRCKSNITSTPTCGSVQETLPIISQFFNFPRIRLPEHNAICPLDGYITTISADHRSPDWLWIALAGRHFRFQLCPHCLIVVGSKMICMG